MAKFIPGRLREIDSSSAKTFDRIRAWINSCDRMHHCVQKEVALPTRVLDVQHPTGLEKICLVESQGRCGKYVALSHCWGHTQGISTTKATFEQRKQAILVPDLPKTYRDVVSIARLLDIRWLWIDSLCIVQDDVSDWRHEASKMGNIYAGAYLTVAASTSNDDSSGCFPQRVTTKYIPPDQKGYSLRERDMSEMVTVITSFKGWRSKLYMFPGWMESSTAEKPLKYEVGTVNPPYDPAEEEHLASRAWTLQERLMSPRIIHYGTDQII